jgi:hypothetical protein
MMKQMITVLTGLMLATAAQGVYRLDSVKDVNVWSIIAEGTIDLRLDALRQEKGDSAALALDGELLGAQQPRRQVLADEADRKMLPPAMR